jgi:hypothetical protein
MDFLSSLISYHYAIPSPLIPWPRCSYLRSTSCMGYRYLLYLIETWYLLVHFGRNYLVCLVSVWIRAQQAYHPQSDGQTERVNQCMETFLCCFVHACPSQWIHWLALAEFWYNSSFHSALGRSPFEALYGYTPHNLGVDISACHNTDLKS